MTKKARNGTNLLDKAKAAVCGRQDRLPVFDQDQLLDLTLAYLRGEIRQIQAAAALGLARGRSGNARTSMGFRLMGAIKNGEVTMPVRKAK